MRSPICHLEPYISGVALNIAPEQKEALLALRDRHNLSFELTDKQESEDASKNIIGIDVTTGVISLPIAALEYLWSCAYTYWVVNQEYAKAQHAGQEKFNATGNERLRDAATLTVWGKNNISTSGVMVWPKTLPDPTQSHLPHDDISIANELFLSALGWIVHHEIGHAALGHPALEVGYSQQQEKDADLHATDWILSNLTPSDLRLQKRALGVAIALLHIQSLEDRSAFSKHPDAHGRLCYCLDRYEIGQQEAIEAFTVVILQLLFHEQGLTADIDGESFKVILGDFILKISRSVNEQ
jgi:hypothetical protein